MSRSIHRAETMSWRVVTPNLPVPARGPAPVPTQLRFLSMPTRPLAPGAAPEAAQSLDAPADLPLGTLFQARGALLVEVPLAGDVTGASPTLGFVAMR